MASFPQTVRHFTPKVDSVDYVYADDMNSVQNEIFAIESTLGINPQGDEDTVAARLSAIETTTLRLTGVQTVAGAKAFADAATFAGGWLVSDLVALALSGTMAAQIGLTAGLNLAFDDTGIQARAAGAASPLRLNPLGGLVHVGSDGLAVDGDAIFSGEITATNGIALGKPLKPTTVDEVGGTSPTGYNSLTSSLQGSWASSAGPYYLLDAAGVVHITGNAHAGTGLILTLPVGVRPIHGFFIKCTDSAGNNWTVRFDIDGTITALDYSGTTNLSLQTSFWVGG